jgi:hypothetical protein
MKVATAAEAVVAAAVACYMVARLAGRATPIPVPVNTCLERLRDEAINNPDAFAAIAHLLVRRRAAWFSRPAIIATVSSMRDYRGAPSTTKQPTT